MASLSNRRQFLQATAFSATLWPAAEWGFLGRLPQVSAAEATGKSGPAPLHAEIEPLVRVIEDTPRGKLLEAVADELRRGRSYRQVLAALLSAGVRNVQPRPSVGFKFHSVLVVNACHLASLSGPDADRWLPIFWALDHFKSAQAEEASKTGWKMGPVDESKVPSAPRCRQAFLDAMDRWDVEMADVATAGIVRHLPAADVFQLFARYAARDFRDIGHKVIFLANAWRTLQVIGWEFAEPVLRSLAFAMLNHGNEPNPATSDLSPDRPWRESAALVEKIPAGWLDNRPSDEATRALIATFRTANAAEAHHAAIDALNRGVGVGSAWDAVFVGSGELLMRQPGIVALHGLTSANALYFLWENVGDEALRRQFVLQACAFNALFRNAAEGRGKLAPRTIDDVANNGPTEPASLEDVFNTISRDKSAAAMKLHAYMQSGGDAQAVIDMARRLIFTKGRDAHDYKFSSAVLEDAAHVTPAWRPLFLALSAFNLKGTQDADSGLLTRTRAALSA